MLQIFRKKQLSQILPPFPRPFWFLTAGSFLNRAGNFVMPFFVLYLTSQRGLSISQATLIISLMGAGSLGASFLGGLLADTLGRRKTILVSLLVSGGLMFALGCIQFIPLLIVCALCLQFFNQLSRPAFSATVADMVPQEQRAQAYSFRYWANNIGSAIGPTIAGLVAPISYFLLFVGDSLTTLLYSLFIWFGVPETRPERSKKQLEKRKQGTLRAALSDPLLWCYSLLALLFNCLYAQWSVALPLDMQAHGLNATIYGLVAASNAVEVIIIALPMTAFFARISQNRALATASLFLGIGLGLYSWLHTLVGYEIGILIWTCGEIIYYPLSSALIASISPTHQRGIYQGIYGTMTGISYLISPALGGFIMQYHGASALWTTCLVIGLLVACSYLVLGRVQETLKKRREKRQQALEAGVSGAWGDD